MKFTPLACCTLALLPFAMPAPAAANDQFKLLAHNVFFLPRTLKPGWGQETRARLIAQADYMKGQDAVILNELFDNPAAAILLAMTLAMNAIAIWIRYRFRKKINW